MILKRIEHHEMVVDSYERVLRATIAKYERALQWKRTEPPQPADTISPDIAYKRLAGMRGRLLRLKFVHGCLSKCLDYNEEVRSLNSIPRTCIHDDVYFEWYHAHFKPIKRRRQSK
jgi:hypothetical protein